MNRTIQPADHTKAGLDQSWDPLGRAGGWFDGGERRAIAAESRAARECGFCADRKAALSPYSATGHHDTLESVLSEHIVDAIHRITTDAETP